MAKRKPTLTLLEMETEMEYHIDWSANPPDLAKRFYSDLRPVPDGTYKKTQREFEEYKKMRYRNHRETISVRKTPTLAATENVARGEDRVTITQRSLGRLYRFAVDIHYSFGFDLPLLFTEEEAFRTMAVAKFQSGTGHKATAAFFNLPREIRERIYAFAIAKGEWRITDLGDFDRVNFSYAIGDPSGFYFPLSKDLTVLRVNKQMRQESLPLVYHRTFFQLDDMDDLIKLLIAVGQTGRQNVESVEFPWGSRADSECKWVEFPDSDHHFLTLPTLHVAKCVKLLEQCKRLRFLRILFERELILSMPFSSFKADPGIQGLCSLRGIEKVEIWSLGNEPLEQLYLAKWLKENIEGSKQGSDDVSRS